MLCSFGSMKTILLFLLGCAAVLAQSDCNKVGYVAGSDGFCYKFVINYTDYYTAAMNCARQGARLATISSDAQSSIIVDLAPVAVYPHSYWPWFIGYNTLGPFKKWTFDSPTENPDQDNYHPWHPDSCSGFHCTTQQGTVTVYSSGGWDMQYPSSYNKFNYICQYMNNNVGSCASQTVAPFPFQLLQATNKCYSIIDSVQQNQAYSENQCRTFGGHLAKVQSQMENDFLLQKFCWECIGNGTTQAFPQAFIGLYVAQDGSYMWTDGTKLQKGDYTNFQNLAGYGKCVVMNFPTGKWSYADCNSYNAYAFCNRDKTAATSMTHPNKHAAQPMIIENS